MKRYFLALVALVAVVFVTGCKDSELAEFASIGSAHVVTVYSGDKPVRVFHATGNVSFQEHGTMIYFKDRDTRKLVEVSGTIVIEQE